MRVACEGRLITKRSVSGDDLLESPVLCVDQAHEDILWWVCLQRLFNDCRFIMMIFDDDPVRVESLCSIQHLSH